MRGDYRDVALIHHTIAVKVQLPARPSSPFKLAGEAKRVENVNLPIVVEVLHTLRRRMR